ncbi:hypothetical protein Clacol_005367 [Clathrus columnatus]|uniref:Sugar phosphate transporter domain-containing protein n=1 Tax=Clathrus columnatus TaxID=1419009 RepID=A0AAV5AF59_9AGAM|nr:hypothetical protein Clacol_005367 [Clathrus columnatus]
MPEDSTIQHVDIALSSVSDFKANAPSTPITPLPPPVTSNSNNNNKTRLSATVIIPIWIVLSSSVITYNNYVYNTLLFKYPVFLVTWHLVFASIGTRILKRTTRLLDGANDTSHLITKDVWLKKIIPVGALFTGSLILSNTAYLYLSVAFIQMLKAFTPVAILLISFTFRIQDPSKRLFMIVFMISGGVSLASYGELKFNMKGFIIQALAVLFEASRLVMIQLLLHGIKMDPLVSLHYYAPVCAGFNLLILPFTDGLAPFYEVVALGPAIMLSNAGVAFLLNIAAVFLVGVGSGLILTLAGVFKDILLIIGSVLLFGTVVTPLQIFGYGIALIGLVIFKTTGAK